MSKKLLSSVSTLFGLTAISYLSVANPAQAQVTNGGFETGDFTGWDRIETFLNNPTPVVTEGDLTSVQTSAYGTNPNNGTYQGLMNFPDPFTIAFDSELDDFLGLTTGTMAGLGAFGGSAIKQSINVSTPSTLSFSYNFLSDEPSNANPFNDFAFYTLDDNVITLADVNGSSFSTSATPFSDETGYQNITPISLGIGTYTLGFGVASVDDSEGLSGILIDNVTLTPDGGGTTTPEPSTILASLFLLTGAALTRKKRLR